MSFVRWKCVIMNNDNDKEDNDNDVEGFITFDTNTTNTDSINDTIVKIEKNDSHIDYYKFLLVDLLGLEEITMGSNVVGIVHVNGHHFFQEDVKLLFRGNNLQQIKKFVNSLRSVSIRTGSSTITPIRFYNSLNTSSNLQQPLNIYKVYNRQDEAFQYFDSLDIHVKKNCKVYSYESINGGIRKFLVADYCSFFKHYCPNNDITTNTNTNNIVRVGPKHVYEIIRYDYPCRAYFDLEYNIQSNPSTNGDKLTALWITLVLWKIYDIWGISLGRENILVLDSSTHEKYSKHISLIIPFSKVRNQNDTEISMTEILFRNNFHVGALVELILEDITEPIEEHIKDPLSPLKSKPIHGRMPKSSFGDLWVYNKDHNKKTCFVDLGVYTRNRMFRLLWSSKYDKKAILNHLYSDKQFYLTSSKRKLESGANIKEIKSDELKKSFIVPFNAYELVYLIENGLNCDDSFLQLSLFNRKLKEYSTSNVENSKIVRSTVLSSSINSNWKDGEVDSSSNANNKRHESPYPLLDKFVLSTLGSKGGSQGSINSWSIYTRNKMNKENITIPAGKYSNYRIRYQLVGNRFCQNIGRQHKSNGIMLEVDFLLSTLTQLCFDSDCKNFRSDPIHVPLNILPDWKELEDKYNGTNELHV